MQAGSWSYNTAYDPIGRVQDASQALLNGPVYAFHVTYKPVIGVSTLTYPSGLVVQTSYDAQGRPTGVTGQIGSNPQTTYLSGTTYQTDGAIQAQTLGNNLQITRSDNARLQPQTIQAGSLLSLNYGYNSTNNNGNVMSQTISRPGLGPLTQTYGYVEGTSSNNRLTSFQENGTCSQAYGYDNRGNRWLNSNNCPNPSPFTPVASSNYDASNHLNIQTSVYHGGNQTQIGGFQFQYDGENRLIASTFSGTDRKSVV